MTELNKQYLDDAFDIVGLWENISHSPVYTGETAKSCIPNIKNRKIPQFL